MDYDTPPLRIESGGARRAGCISFAIVAVIFLFSARELASLAVDYQWWKEMGQLETWFSMWIYGWSPAIAATIIAFLAFSIAHARGLKFSHVVLGRRSLYRKISALVLFVVAVITALSTTDTWTTVRYFGGKGIHSEAATWRDPVFGNTLAFYFFQVPFYSLLLRFVLVVAVGAAVIYWLTARVGQMRGSFSDWQHQLPLDLSGLRLTGAFESRFLRMLGALFLVALAAQYFLDRYDMLLNEHQFMVGIDYTNQNLGLPLQWVMIVACLLAAIAVLAGRFRFALVLVLAFLLRAVVPPIVAAAYVRPNEISLEKPFIQRHIEATRSAFGIDRRGKELDYVAHPDARIDPNKHRALLDNVRLWDWRAFHDTLLQIQPLRPFTFADTDVDRYMIDGQLRQILLSPRELDLTQLGDARNNWINPNFIYTHGYGLVVAEANRITPSGMPSLFIRNAPPEISTPSLKLTRPELYFNETARNPVFVRTAQAEFNYPSGSQNVYSRYDGRGGFPMSSLMMRTAAAIARTDYNILLTSILTPESRMMIRRQLAERLDALAGFLLWDPDPYIVITKEGRLVWMIDGYMTSSAHPYSRSVNIEGAGPVNYIRNSVKATIDAYDGTTKLYVFDPTDPLVQAYQHLFPKLFLPASAMPADLREHARYPEVMFAVQAEIYRTFHMRDPESFYNKADLWDLARYTRGQEQHPEPVTPSYLIASMPGSSDPEFVLMIPFTPRGRDNLIGLMIARCDGDHLGDIVYLMLSKQDVIPGPIQIEARINQDQNISKDLTLWNQQGSQVLRGQMVVLPIEDTFLYVEPIYIEASEAKMPQLRKVAVSMGNNIVYADTYQQALAQLGATPGEEAVPQTNQPAGTQTAAAPTPARPGQDPRIGEIRRHLERYRDLVSQGKWSEAGRELEAVQGLVQK